MIKERVVQVIEIKGIAKEKFFEKIGVTSANFRGNARKTPLNSTTIENILSEIPELNPEWLLTGKGSIFKENKSPINQNLNGDDNIMIGGNNSGQVANKKNSEGQIIKDLQTEIIRLKNLLEEKEKQLTEKEKQISKLIDKLTK